MKPPKRIWLQRYDDPNDITWCQHKVNDDDVEYVIANTAEDEPDFNLMMMQGHDALVEEFGEDYDLREVYIQQESEE